MIATDLVFVLARLLYELCAIDRSMEHREVRFLKELLQRRLSDRKALLSAGIFDRGKYH
jgi:hypothetical protein